MKSIRSALGLVPGILLLVIIGYSGKLLEKAFTAYGKLQGLAQKVGDKATFLWEKFPKFVLGFLVVSLLASAQVFDKGQLTSLGNLSRWAFLLTFAGVGLNTDFRAMWKQGAWPFVAGIVGGTLNRICHTLSRHFHERYDRSVTSPIRNTRF